ncbi:hypothetical protein G9C98_000755 [Cotesia typhae]|uniref:Uncharacterized protein n=1 Tax=Cotesia typhae TaxID=2053667 RepID=A0A8J5UW50_9HYME|nr:hypothetical protein G9C98_000755 [Cotesia typhae]
MRQLYLLIGASNPRPEPGTVSAQKRKSRPLQHNPFHGEQEAEPTRTPHFNVSGSTARLL